MKHLAGSLSLNSHLSNGVPTDPCDWCVLLGILRDLSLIERTAKTGDFVVDVLKQKSHLKNKLATLVDAISETITE